MNTENLMDRALTLALRGWGRVHPNPMVGAVVLRDDRVVGEGYHAEFGQVHAERMALEQAGDAARGGTLIVTLEPCHHQGKQPPCSGLVLERGIARVVVASRDPNPEAGGGVEYLRDAGVEVQVGVREEAAKQLNAGFFHAMSRRTRPFVVLKLATSIDFRIADRRGGSRWISGPEAREWVHWLRAGFDGIAVGGGTVRQDNPSLTVRGRVEPRIPPRRIVFTRSGDIPAASTVFVPGVGPATWVVVGPPASELGLDLIAGTGAKILPAPGLEEALEMLRSEGVTTLLVEGGGRFAGSLLAGDLVDRFHWIQAPIWLGDEGVPAAVGLPAPAIELAPRWTVVSRLALGEDQVVTLDRRSCSLEL